MRLYLSIPPALLAERMAQELRDIGEAAVRLTKFASDAVKVHALSGELQFSSSGWGLLKVPNALVRGAFDALDEAGAELPLRSNGQLNGHISVFRKEEIEQIGGADKIKEFGHHFHYTLGPVKEVVPAGWDTMSKCWFIEVSSPELQTLRKTYGLTPLPNGDHPFHITVGVRKKHILHDNDTKKAASVSTDKPVCPKCASSDVGTYRHRGAPWVCQACRHEWPKDVIKTADAVEHLLGLLNKCSEKRGPEGEYCPHCDARLERDPYSGRCNRCGKDGPEKGAAHIPVGGTVAYDYHCTPCDHSFDGQGGVCPLCNKSRTSTNASGKAIWRKGDAKEAAIEKLAAGLIGMGIGTRRNVPLFKNVTVAPKPTAPVAAFKPAPTTAPAVPTRASLQAPAVPTRSSISAPPAPTPTSAVPQGTGRAMMADMGNGSVASARVVGGQNLPVNLQRQGLSDAGRSFQRNPGLLGRSADYESIAYRAGAPTQYRRHELTHSLIDAATTTPSLSKNMPLLWRSAASLSRSPAGTAQKDLGLLLHETAAHGAEYRSRLGQMYGMGKFWLDPRRVGAYSNALNTTAGKMMYRAPLAATAATAVGATGAAGRAGYNLLTTPAQPAEGQPQ